MGKRERHYSLINNRGIPHKTKTMSTLKTNPELMTVIINIQTMREKMNAKHGNKYDKELDFSRLEIMSGEELYHVQGVLIPHYNQSI